MKIHTVQELMDARLDWFENNAYCKGTWITQRDALKKFQIWSKDRNLCQLEDIRLTELESYQRWLYHQTKTSGQSLSVIYQHKLMQIVKSCFYWASEQQRINYNPAMGLIMPRLPQRLPKAV